MVYVTIDPATLNSLAAVLTGLAALTWAWRRKA